MSVDNRCRDLDLHGISGDVCREDPEAPPPIFVTIFAWVYAWQWPGILWMALRNICLLETPESLITG
jgi:hypothetical protein